MYVTRNSDKYLHGKFDLSFNKAYENGINGLVVHKTDRARVKGNKIFNNGQVSTNAPDSRQPYAGLTINQSKNVEVSENFVKTESKDDYAYNLVSGSTLINSSGNNKLCKVAPQAGTGFGKLAEKFESFVQTATWTECKNAFNAEIL